VLPLAFSIYYVTVELKVCVVKWA